VMVAAVVAHCPYIAKLSPLALHFY